MRISDCSSDVCSSDLDRVDKRRFLIVVNVGLAVVVTALAALTALGWMTSSGLLAFTFVIGTGAAFMAPAWQAIVPSLVPREILQPAIALNSMVINISRAIGPALAGFLITALGLSAHFVVNADIGRPHVCTPVTNAHLVCRLLLQTKS